MDNSMIRQRARENLAGRWGGAMAVAVAAALLGGTAGNLISQITAQLRLDDMFTLELYRGLRLTINISMVLAAVLSGVLELGKCRFFLKLCRRREEPTFGDLFSQFDRFGDAWVQFFLRLLYTTLWSLLLIIPGIVAGYRYAMTPYIMLDHPELSPSEAITASKEMMNGHKWELFTLQLSFIGWELLAIFTLGIGYLWVTPYYAAADAVFYRTLSGEVQ